MMAETRGPVNALKVRKLGKFDLGRRYSAEENFSRKLFALEEDITTKIEDALSREDYGEVGAHLRDFYIRVCELIDKTRAEMKAVKIKMVPTRPNLSKIKFANRSTKKSTSRSRRTTP